MVTFGGNVAVGGAAVAAVVVVTVAVGVGTPPADSVKARSLATRVAVASAGETPVPPGPVLPRISANPRVATRTSVPTAASGDGPVRGARPRSRRGHEGRPPPIPSSTPRLTLGLAGRRGRSRSPRASVLVWSAKRRHVGQAARWVSSARLSAGSSGPSMRAETRAWAWSWEIMADLPAGTRTPSGPRCPRPPRRRRSPRPGRPPRTPCGRGTGAASRHSR